MISVHTACHGEYMQIRLKHAGYCLAILMVMLVGSGCSFSLNAVDPRPITLLENNELVRMYAVSVEITVAPAPSGYRIFLTDQTPERLSEKDLLRHLDAIPVGRSILTPRRKLLDEVKAMRLETSEYRWLWILSMKPLIVAVGAVSEANYQPHGPPLRSSRERTESIETLFTELQFADSTSFVYSPNLSETVYAIWVQDSPTSAVNRLPLYPPSTINEVLLRKPWLMPLTAEAK
jgi:hypothetical protein